MSTLKKGLKILGIVILIVVVFLGIKISLKYYTAQKDIKSLDESVLGLEITQDERMEAENLEQGQILSKKLITLSKIKPVWKKFSEDNVLKPEFNYLDELSFYSITYKSDDLLVNGIIAEPKGVGKFPVIIFNRGGNKEIGKISRARTLYSLIYAASRLASEGYIVLASCYRENDEFGGKDINDVLNLTKTAKELDNADPQRIGMFGWSRGGMMTYLALKNPGIIKTAVVGNGPSDLPRIIIDRPEMDSEVFAKLIPNYEENKKEELEKRSVLFWTEELDKKASLLILCGTEDKRVNPEQANTLAEKLTEINFDFQLKKFQTDHKFSGKIDELNEVLIQWFKDEL